MKPRLGAPAGPRHQRGVALLIAVLIVALLATASTWLAWDQTLAIRRSEDMLASDQTWALALGAEAIAAQGLATTLRGSNSVNFTQAWAKPQQGRMGGALVAGALIDLQGRFNLNDLSATAPNNAVMRTRFQLMLRSAGVDPRLVQAVVDWVSPIPEATGVMGAGDTYYLGLQPPYRTAAVPFVSASSLRLVRGIEQPAYQLLAPLVTALPQVTAINVNTAPAGVLEAIGLTPDQARAIVALRSKTPFDNLAQFLASAPLAGQPVDTSGLTTGSNFFESAIQVRMGRVQGNLDSVLALQNNGKVHVLLRARNVTP